VYAAAVILDFHCVEAALLCTYAIVTNFTRHAGITPESGFGLQCWPTGIVEHFEREEATQAVREQPEMVIEPNRTPDEAD
jgi:hypothetical protein